MTSSIKKFIDVHLRTLPKGSKVLEVGSLDVNGSPDRADFDYTGLDMRPGKGVDIVQNSHHLPFAPDWFDAVVCAEMLEHDDEPLKTLFEIRKVLKPSGMFICTVPGSGFNKHDYPSDYWRLTPEGMKVWLRDFQIHSVEEVEKCVRAIAYK